MHVRFCVCIVVVVVVVVVLYYAFGGYVFVCGFCFRCLFSFAKLFPFAFRLCWVSRDFLRICFECLVYMLFLFIGLIHVGVVCVVVPRCLRKIPLGQGSLYNTKA